MIIDVNFMLVGKVAAVNRKLASAPNKFKVFLSLVLRELIKHLPEPLDALVLAVNIVTWDFLKLLNVDVFCSTCTEFDVLPRQEMQNARVNNVGEAIFYPVHLLFILAEASLDHKLNKLFVVGMIDFLFLASFAQLNLFTIR